MKPTHTHDQLIFEQAAQWHLLMQKSPDLGVREAFDDWLMESRRHIRNYLLVVALDKELTHIDPERRLEINKPATGAAGSEIVPLQPPFAPPPLLLHKRRGATPSTSIRRHRRSGWRWPAASAAALALLIFAALLMPWDFAGHYSTTIGEQRIIKLADGSVMYLNTQSRAHIDYSQYRRDIDLLQGEALFVVARDTARPFRVTSGKAVIQAIGTEFNVYRRDKETQVSVLEGRVQVFADNDGRIVKSETTPARRTRATLPLGAGETVNVRNDGSIIKHHTADAGNAAVWRERRLVFREHPLSEIATEFNRYNSAPRFRVEDTNAGTRRYSGIFDAYDPESLAQVLSADDDLTLDRVDDEIVIRRR